MIWFYHWIVTLKSILACTVSRLKFLMFCVFCRVREGERGGKGALKAERAAGEIGAFDGLAAAACCCQAAWTPAHSFAPLTVSPAPQ